MMVTPLEGKATEKGKLMENSKGGKGVTKRGRKEKI